MWATSKHLNVLQRGRTGYPKPLDSIWKGLGEIGSLDPPRAAENAPDSRLDSKPCESHPILEEKQIDSASQRRSDLHGRFTDILDDLASSTHVVMEGTCLWMDSRRIPLMNEQFLLLQSQKVCNHIDSPGHVRDWAIEVCGRMGRGGFIREALLVDSVKGG